jgi:hypothetical protein
MQHLLLRLLRLLLWRPRLLELLPPLPPLLTNEEGGGLILLGLLRSFAEDALSRLETK